MTIFKKTAFIAIMTFSLTMGTSNQAKAYIPIIEILTGIQIAHTLYVEARPALQAVGRAIHRKSQAAYNYIKHRNQRADYQELEDLEQQPLLHRSSSRSMKFDDFDDRYGFAAPAA